MFSLPPAVAQHPLLSENKQMFLSQMETHMLPNRYMTISVEWLLSPRTRMMCNLSGMSLTWDSWHVVGRTWELWSGRQLSLMNVSLYKVGFLMKTCESHARTHAHTHTLGCKHPYIPADHSERDHSKVLSSIARCLTCNSSSTHRTVQSDRIIT